MNKTTTTITIIITLAIGIFIGYGLGFGETSHDHDPVMQDEHQTADSAMSEDHADSMSMEQMMLDMNAELEGKLGDDFDKAFITEMIVHHQGAVAMAEAALRSSSRKEILDLANAIIEAQNSEIESMEEWNRSWFGK